MKAVITAVLLLAAPAAAQQDLSKVEIRTENIAPGVDVLFGAGGNIGVSSGVDGVFIIDDQFSPLTAKIQAAIAKLSPKPVRFVFNTHWHGDHTGGNENFGTAGAVIVAHDNVRQRMSTDQFIAAFKSTVKASPAIALPVVTFADGVTFHLNGETIKVVHVPPAHTDGDSIVRFEKANAIHMGDNYFASSYPYIDLSSGGSVLGVIAAADTALTMGDAKTRYIPGHGPLTGREELKAYRAMISEIVAKVQTGIKAGQSLDAIKAAKPTAAYDAKWGGGFINPDNFVTIVHMSLTAAK